MKTYRSDFEPNRFGVCDMEGNGTEEVMNCVLTALQKNNIAVGERQMMPYCDLYDGVWKGVPFSIIADIDYGVDILCEHSSTLDALENEINRFE